MPDELIKEGQDPEEKETGAEGGKPETEAKKEGLPVWATVLISVITALATALLAPYFSERLKDAETTRQFEKAKREKIIATQYEIVERFNSTFWHYRQASGFLMFDFLNGQSDDLLK